MISFILNFKTPVINIVGSRRAGMKSANMHCTSIRNYRNWRFERTRISRCDAIGRARVVVFVEIVRVESESSTYFKKKLISLARVFLSIWGQKSSRKTVCGSKPLSNGQFRPFMTNGCDGPAG